jgi:Ca2+-binding RTX toxin-like protein
VDAFLNGGFIGRYEPVSKVLVWGLDGNDDIQIDPKVNLPAILIGDKGNDSNVGSTANDILIGGAGADSQIGNNGDDLLVGGSTQFDHDISALARLSKEWVSGGDFKNRMNDIAHGTGFTGGTALNAATLISDGTASDILTGGGGHDWSLFGSNDSITDLTKDDAATFFA